jgi:hypothetical protein
LLAAGQQSHARQKEGFRIERYFQGGVNFA